jgi:hypothetical protein
LALGVIALLGCLSAAQAHGGWSVGFSFGVPVYPRPCCGYPYYHYYRPYPVVVEPAPVIVQPAPVHQPVPVAPPVYPAPAVAPAAAVTAHAPVAAVRQDEVEHQLGRLAALDEQSRADAAVQLGWMKVERAVDPLAATLAGDASPTVREAAARALGLIGSPKALPALMRAAQADGDRDVRHSARFAVEVVESGPGR